jgi:hypothetical protein
VSTVPVRPGIVAGSLGVYVVPPGMAAGCTCPEMGLPSAVRTCTNVPGAMFMSLSGSCGCAPVVVSLAPEPAAPGEPGGGPTMARPTASCVTVRVWSTRANSEERSE